MYRSCGIRFWILFLCYDATMRRCVSRVKARWENQRAAFGDKWAVWSWVLFDETSRWGLETRGPHLMLNVSREYGSFSAKCTLEMKAGTVCTGKFSLHRVQRCWNKRKLTNFLTHLFSRIKASQKLYFLSQVRILLSTWESPYNKKLSLTFSCFSVFLLLFCIAIPREKCIEAR